MEAALGRLETLAEGPARHHVSVMRSAPDLVEAAVRIGQPGRAAVPLERFERWAGRARQPWTDALALRCRALLAPDPEAESLYVAAQLFLSPRTVGYHLYKAYPKLGVAARSELPDLLYDER